MNSMDGSRIGMADQKKRNNFSSKALQLVEIKLLVKEHKAFITILSELL